MNEVRNSRRCLILILRRRNDAFCVVRACTAVETLPRPDCASPGSHDAILWVKTMHFNQPTERCKRLNVGVPIALDSGALFEAFLRAEGGFDGKKNNKRREDGGDPIQLESCCCCRCRCWAPRTASPPRRERLGRRGQQRTRSFAAWWMVTTKGRPIMMGGVTSLCGVRECSVCVCARARSPAGLSNVMVTFFS